MTFQEIMDYSPGNQAVYGDIKQNIDKILPFVGAGLTAAVYSGWGTAVTALGEKLPREADRNRLSGLLKRYEYLGAAQLLQNKLGKEKLRDEMVFYFRREKLEQNWSTLREQAIFLLPLLFPCPVLTTNFDEGIEMVYQYWLEGDFRILNPASQSLRQQAAKRRTTPCLFKLHGSIYGDMADERELVFTRTQYNRHYGLFGDTKAALKAFVNRRGLLFLGCSLEKDRTVDVIRRQAGRGRTHYAILSCKPGTEKQRIQAMEKMNIRAIVYPDGEYTAVRTVLAQLLLELHPKKYKLLEQSNAALSGPPPKPYEYRANMTALQGRKTELDKLTEFVTSTKDPFRWWAVTGPGGSGKSRLALELQKRISGAYGWTCKNCGTRKDYADLEGFFDACTHSTLVVVDYVNTHARALGEQMALLMDKERSHPLRVLLLERGDTAGGSEWTEQLYPNPYDRNQLERLCWQPDFLALSPLEDAQLRAVIRSFAENLRQSGLSSHPAPTDQDCKDLLDRLKAIDGDLRRPLYALFLTGAWMQGEDPAHWDRRDVLDYITDRECGLLQARLRELTRREMPSWSRACLTLYRLATARLGPELEEAKAVFPKKKWEYIVAAAAEAGLEGPEELLERLGLLRGNGLVPMQPDLMGEYFVLKGLLVEEREKAQRPAFLSAVWKAPASAYSFFNRLFSDYAHQLNQSPDQWGMLLLPLEELLSEPGEEESLRYARLSVQALRHCTDVHQCGRLADQLESVYKRFPNNREIVLALAYGMVVLTLKQDVDGIKATIARLEELVKAWPKEREMALDLAMGLVNLSTEQDAAGASATVARLEKLAEERPKEREITLILAKGLVRLTAKQDVDGRQATVARLEQLVKKWPKEREMALDLAMGLVNLSANQDVDGRQAAVARLEQLVKKWQKERKIVQALAEGLVNLSANPDVDGIQAAVARLEELVKEWPKERGIAQELAKGLVNLTVKQDVESIKATIARLEELVEEWPKEQEIALRLANGLVNLSAKQDVDGIKATIARLEELVKEWPKDRETALTLAKGLVNLAANEDAFGAKAAVTRLEGLAGQRPDDRETALTLAKGLVNLINKRAPGGSEETLCLLEDLTEQWNYDIEFMRQLAKGLAAFSNEQDRTGAGATVVRLEQMAKQQPDDRELAQALAMGLAILSTKQSTAAQAAQILDRINPLMERFPHDSEIERFAALGCQRLLERGDSHYKP